MEKSIESMHEELRKTAGEIRKNEDNFSREVNVISRKDARESISPLERDGIKSRIKILERKTPPFANKIHGSSR